MFIGSGYRTPRKQAERVANPAAFRELVGFDTVQGRPTYMSPGQPSDIGQNPGVNAGPSLKSPTPFILK